jgi:serine/threonine protein phosphatase PrpC
MTDSSLAGPDVEDVEPEVDVPAHETFEFESTGETLTVEASPTDSPIQSSAQPSGDLGDQAEADAEDLASSVDVGQGASVEPDLAESVIPDPDVAEDGQFTFGPAGRLRPVPTRTAKQSPVSLEHVPDIALDWVELSFADVRAVSARGHMHRYLGEVRQDCFAVEAADTYLAVAVADGLGSACQSHAGSSIAAREVTRDAKIIEGVVASASDGSVTLNDLATILSHEARRQKVDAREVATTLVLAVVAGGKNEAGEYEVVLAQIGDSTAWRCTETGWLQLGQIESQEEIVSTAVDPLPLHDQAYVWRETFSSGDTLALVSDGVGNILSANPSFKRELARLWSGSAPSLGDLLKVLDASVKTFDDDRTFVGVRFP